LYGALQGKSAVFYSIEVSIAKSKHCHVLLPCRCITPFPWQTPYRKNLVETSYFSHYIVKAQAFTQDCSQHLTCLRIYAWLFTVGIAYSPSVHPLKPIYVLCLSLKLGKGVEGAFSF